MGLLANIAPPTAPIAPMTTGAIDICGKPVGTDTILVPGHKS